MKIIKLKLTNRPSKNLFKYCPIKLSNFKQIVIMAFLTLSKMVVAQNQIVSNGQNIILNNQNITRSNITVNTGGELRLIGCNLTMDIAGRITINPGGRLFLINTTVNCASTNDYWEGIIIEGNPTLPQSPTTNQGFVNISQSKINRAKIALATRSIDAVGNIIWSKTGGGIVIVSNTMIRDCKYKHVEFWSYKNKVNGKEINNLSRFTNCAFWQTNIRYPQIYVNPSSNPNILSNYSTPFMITLWDVKGVTFNGCAFLGTYPMDINDRFDYQKSFHSPSGILTYDASVIIQDNKSTTPNTVARRGSFTGLNVSVANYYSAINDDIVNINNCDFGHSDIDICHNGGTGSFIYRNNFRLNFWLSNAPYGSGFHSQSGTKLMVDNSIGLLIEENSFNQLHIGGTQPEPLLSTKWATVITNSDRGMAGQPIPLSNYKRNNNRYGLSSLQTQKGNAKLKITCNTFNNGATISTNYAGQINFNPVTQTGLTPFFGNCQGSNLVDYNNVFGNIQPNQADIFNYTTATPNLTYVVKSTEPYRPAQTKSYQMNITNCGDANSVMPISCISTLPAEPNWQIGVPANFNSNVYFGKKAQVVNQQAIIADPSSTALQKANAQIELDGLLRDLSEMRADKLRYHQYMHLFDEPSEDHLEELILFLQSDNDLFSKKMLLGIYINQQQFQLAQSVLATLPTNTSDDLAYKNLCELLVNLGIENRNIFMLTEAEQFAIREIAYGSTTSAVDAQGILAIVYNEVLAKHIEKYPGADNIDKEMYELKAAQNSRLTIYPNPANAENITALFETASYSNNKQIKIYNYIGTLMAEVNLDAGIQNGEISLDILGFETGLYSVHFVIDGVVVAHKTLSYVQ